MRFNFWLLVSVKQVCSLSNDVFSKSSCFKLHDNLWLSWVENVYFCLDRHRMCNSIFVSLSIYYCTTFEKAGPMVVHWKRRDRDNTWLLHVAISKLSSNGFFSDIMAHKLLHCWLHLTLYLLKFLDLNDNMLTVAMLTFSKWCLQFP